MFRKVNIPIPLLNEVPKLLERYLYCVDESISQRIQASFHMKSFMINKQLYSEIPEKLCKKIDIYKHKNQEELLAQYKDIERLENLVIGKNKRIAH